MMVCVVCNGSGCDECKKTGSISILECPLKIITPDIWELLDHADLYINHGLPVVVGGQMDQSAGFIDACKFISSEQRFWKNNLGISS